MGKTERSDTGPLSWIKSVKLKQTQHLDFTINENGLVKRINTIFFAQVVNKECESTKENPQRLPFGRRWGSAQEA